MRSAIFIWSIGLLMFSVTLMVRVGAVFDSFFDDMTGDEGYINGFIEEYQLGTISPGSFTGVPLHIDYYILKKTKDYITKYEPEELMAELSKPMEPIEDTTGPYKISVGKQVAELLAATRDKSRANTILGQFSVDDLLSLNRIHSSECVLTVRDKKWKPICDKIHEAGHKNLELYCKKTLNNLKDCCVFSRFFIMGQELRKMGKRKEAIKFLTLVGNVVKFDRKVEKRKRKKEVKRREAARKKLEAERERIRKELNEDDNRDSVQDDNLAYDVAIAVENVSQEMLTEYYKKVLKAVFEHEGESYENEIRSICEKMTNTMRDKYGIVDDDIIPINKYMITFTRFSKHCQIILTKLPSLALDTPGAGDKNGWP